jgi:hypothetical protein
MQRDYPNIKAILSDLGQWKCLWIYDATLKPVPAFWHCMQLGGISWRCNGLRTMAGPLEPYAIVNYATDESPDEAMAILQRWMYRAEMHWSRPEMLDYFNLQQHVPFRYRMQPCIKGTRAALRDYQGNLFT